MNRELPFEDVPSRSGRARAAGEDELVLDLDGYEGPLDLLLDLARRQKVDLARISILSLAEQYLAFIEHARSLRLELAADYLVMAAWLAYLKSRLLLPEPPRADEPSAADLAAALAQRLERLGRMRDAARWLSSRPQLGRDVFARGHSGEGAAERNPDGPIAATLYDLLSAYARQRQKRAAATVVLARRFVWSLAEARNALQRLVGDAGLSGWQDLDAFLMAFVIEPAMAATVRASALSAMLEMVREGQAEVRQDRAFAPIYVRRRGAARLPEAAAPAEAGQRRRA